MTNKELREKIVGLEKEVQDLRDFKKRIELGQRWLLCAIYAIGGLVGFIYTTIQIIKDFPKVH